MYAKRWMKLGSAATVVVTALVVSACSKGEGDRGTGSVFTGPDPTVASSSAAPDTRLADAKAALLAFVALDTKLNQSPDPNNPDLPKLATGDALANEQRAYNKYLNEHEAQRIDSTTPYSFTIESSRLDGDDAKFDACQVDGSVLYHTDTNQIVNSEIASRHIRIVVISREGAWKVSVFDDSQKAYGVQSCAGIPLPSPDGALRNIAATTAAGANRCCR